jgi:hypothetical protein
MVNVVCPVCGEVGFLEVRGCSERVLHYRGVVDGKKAYVKHGLGAHARTWENGNTNGNTSSMNLVKAEQGSFGEDSVNKHSIGFLENEGRGARAVIGLVSKTSGLEPQGFESLPLRFSK